MNPRQKSDKKRRPARQKKAPVSQIVFFITECPFRSLPDFFYINPSAVIRLGLPIHSVARACRICFIAYVLGIKLYVLGLCKFCAQHWVRRIHNLYSGNVVRRDAASFFVPLAGLCGFKPQLEDSKAVKPYLVAEQHVLWHCEEQYGAALIAKTSSKILQKSMLVFCCSLG